MKIYVDKKANVGRTLSCPDKKRNVQLKTNVIQRYLHAYYLGNKKFNLQGNLQTTKDGKCAYPIEHLDGQGKAFFVAEDLSFAIFGEGYPKTFFATNESIRKSNNKLREVDSYVHLKKKDNSTIELEGQRDEIIKLYEVFPINIYAKPEQNKMFFDVCIEMAGLVAGTRSFYNNKIKKGDNWIPSRFDNLKSEEVYDLAKEIGELPENEKVDLIRKYRINQYASPDIGEAFSIISYLNNENPAENKKWGYHFAGVVAKSSTGSDFITLENYNRMIEKEELGFKSRPNDETDNKLTAWYFQIYGTKKDQSFHYKQEATNSYINPITVSVSKSNNTEEKNKWKDKFNKLHELTKELSINFELYDNVLYTIDNNFNDKYIKALSHVYSYYVDKIKFKIKLITDIINNKYLEQEQKGQFVTQTMNNDTSFRIYIYQLAYNHPNETKESAKSILNSKILSLLSKGYTIDYMPFI